MKSFEYAPNEFLVYQPIAAARITPPKHASTNHIWVIDRSGSMSGHLSRVLTQIKTQARKIPVGDTLTVLWFSGKGQKDVIIKGSRIDGTTFDAIDYAIDRYSSTVGATCFSETLIDLKKHLDDLGAFGERSMLVFMTDGHPVVDDVAREMASIKSAIAACAGQLSATVLVGYSEGYNRELLVDMAQRFNGSMVHASEVDEFGLTLATFVDGSLTTSQTRRIGVEVCSVQVDGVFSVPSTGSVVAHPLAADPALIMAMPAKGTSLSVMTSADSVYVLGRGPLNDVPVVGDVSTDEDLLRGAYAAAIVLIRGAKVDTALKVLNKVGDKAIMQLVLNSYTNNEFGKVERALMAAVSDNAARFVDGRDTNYLPDPNAPCIVDLLTALMADVDARFMPYHPAFMYKKITRSTQQATGYPKFEANRDVSIPFSSLTWHKTKLNLSILARIPGTIALHDVGDASPQTPASIGLASPFSTYKYRNYSIIKDGTLNVNKLPVKLGYNSRQFALELGVVENPNPDDGVYVLNLTKLPLINRALAKQTSGVTLAQQALEELRLECVLKVLKPRMKDHDEAETRVKYTEAQEKFLEAHGIRPKDGSFSPPVASHNSPATDYYISRSFEIKIKGASSLPSVNDVTTKMTNGKALNLPGKFMADAIKITDDRVPHEFAKVKTTLAAVRKDIQATKFALLLAHKWLDEFSSRDGCSLDVRNAYGDTTTVTFVLSEEKTPID